MTAVCIAGMHRSGTSMIARMLNICGLYLGPPQDLGAPARDNPAGFWENLKIVENNERILAAFGGGWDIPPRFPDNWVDSALLLAERNTALQLIGDLGAHGTWGWKDPRTSLTLPFWRQLIPDLKVVVAIRNPVDIWRSLYARGASSFALGSHLTGRYLKSVRVSSEADGRMVTHYDAFFEDPAYELRRLIGFLGLEATPGDIENACKQVRRDLRHTQSTLLDLLSSDAPSNVIEEYVLLCMEAGTRYQPVLARELQACFPPGEPRVDLAEWGSALKRVGSSLARRGSESVADPQAAHLETTARGEDAGTQQPVQTVEALTARVAKQELSLLTLRAQLGAEKQKARALSGQLVATSHHVEDLTNALKDIHQSRLWRLGQSLARVYRWFVPRRPADHG